MTTDANNAALSPGKPGKRAALLCLYEYEYEYEYEAVSYPDQASSLRPPIHTPRRFRS